MPGANRHIKSNYFSPSFQHFAYLIFILSTLLFLMMLVPGVYASSSYLPFDGKQTLLLPGAKADFHIYKNGSSGYLMLSYKTHPLNDDRDILIQVLDKEGKQLSQEVYERPGDDSLILAHQCSKGLLLAVSNPQESGNDIYLLKIDNKAKKEWVREYAGDGIGSIASTNDDGFIVAGYKNSADTGKDLYIIKMDKKGLWKSSGNKDVYCWEKSFAVQGDQEARYVSQVFDEDKFNDGYIITGYSTGKGQDNRDVNLVRLDAYGEKKWDKNHGGERNDEGLFVIPIHYEDNKKLAGFFTAGYTCSQGIGSDKNMYLLYTDPNGYKKRWEGHERTIDGLSEKIYGGSLDEIAYAVYEVPKAFENERKLQGEKVEGDGGFVLLGIRYDGKDSEILMIRIDDRGRDLWKKELEFKGDHLLPAELKDDSGDFVNLVYTYSFPQLNETTMDFNTLKHYLDGVIKEDKSIPKADQKETNREDVKWETVTLKYAGYRDKGKEIKEIMARENISVLQRKVSQYSKGKIVWPDTSYYFGKMYLGKADGWGTLIFPDGVRYEGQWKDNMFNGKGTLFFPSGEKYQGMFKEHCMFGKGVFTWPTGERYEGDFEWNKRHGQGVFTWPGGVRYAGEFEKDKASGTGKITWPNGEKYEGQMKDGQPNGQGTYYFPNGELYRGEFKGLTFEGVGAYHWPDGSHYIGEFKGDMLNGQGYYIWPNRVQQWGYWKNDRYLGIHPESDK